METYTETFLLQGKDPVCPYKKAGTKPEKRRNPVDFPRGRGFWELEDGAEGGLAGVGADLPRVGSQCLNCAPFAGRSSRVGGVGGLAGSPS